MHTAASCGPKACKSIHSTTYEVICSLELLMSTVCPLGKILNDASALKEYNISESNFVVVMVSKVSIL